MSMCKRFLVIGLAFALLPSCADLDESQETPVVPPAGEEPAALAPEAAESLVLDETTEFDGPWLFAFETEPEVMALTLHGTGQAQLAGRLADRDGRREVVYYGAERAAPLVLFKADWLLPGVGATNRMGETLVCVNRLVGETSELTKGDLPDPANGVDLFCRWHGPRGWTRELKVPRRNVAALWLDDVVALRDGSFRITFSKDATGHLVDDSGKTAELEGIYRVGFDRGRFGNPELAYRFQAP